MTEHARVVVIGGGIVGASVAYHLTRLGITDVLLLERRSLTCGTTWHAAGLIGRLRGTRTASRIVDDSARLYARLEEETGHATGWKRCGSLIVARTAERLHQLRRYVALARRSASRLTSSARTTCARCGRSVVPTISPGRWSSPTTVA